MASLILHLTISNELNKEYNLSSDFLVGTIAPDMLKIIYGKDASHYNKQIQLKDEIRRFPDIDEFLKQNPNRNDDYFIGYLVHLVQDKIWFDEFAPKKVKVLSKEKTMYHEDGSIHDMKEATKDLYNDYYIIESYLFEKYGEYDIKKLKEDTKKYFKEKENMNIDETIDNEKISYKNEEKREFKIFSYEIVDEFINYSINECKKYIDTIKGSK